MQQLPEALAPLGVYRQFCLYKLVPSSTRPGKTDKFPCDIAGEVRNAHDPSIWLDAATAMQAAAIFGPSYGVAFVFTPNDPFFFLDIDDCLQGSAWSPLALELLGTLSGAAVEISQSGRGLHVFGSYAGPEPAHGCKNVALGLELYTSLRFVALTGDGALGSAAFDCTGSLSAVIGKYFAAGEEMTPADWTTEAVSEYTGPEDDDELIERACASQSAGSVFSNKANFAQLWNCDEDALAKAYPDPSRADGGAYGKNEADAALAQHLAFWTGKNCERILRLMQRSGLVRDKWEQREGYYLERTILRAVSLQTAVYSVAPVDTTVAEQAGAPKLKGSPKQIEYAGTIRAQKLSTCVNDAELVKRLCAAHGPTVESKFWIENQHLTPEELGEKVKPVEKTLDPIRGVKAPELVAGYQYLGAEQQMEHFAGCVYIQDLHRVFTPSGMLLKPEQFNATYGGYAFQYDSNGGSKTTKKAWEAFVESQAVRYPIAESTCFRPELPPGEIIEDDKWILVNTYIPIDTPRTAGDPTPFLNHLLKILPDEKDRAIIIAYMAAIVQYKGTKFQWAPLIQGTEGNGKSFLTDCMEAAVGIRYSHKPPADQISEKYNSWLFGKLFIGVEDIYVPEKKREVIEILKPMITSRRLARRAMQTDQVMQDVRCNFIFNSNHRDAVRKTENDRRFAVFYCAQQTEADIVRDGMGGGYFPRLYEWARRGGFAIINDFLTTYAIPEELNPAVACHRAPRTSSTDAAILAGMGSIEQEILEAIDEGRPGFAGGWVSSMALDRLLQSLRAERTIPHNKRRELLQDLGYDWHPALRDGRVNNHISIDGGKPRLFVKRDNIAALNLTNAADVVKYYERAQTAQNEPTAGAVAIFGKDKGL